MLTFVYNNTNHVKINSYFEKNGFLFFNAVKRPAEAFSQTSLKEPVLSYLPAAIRMRSIINYKYFEANEYVYIIQKNTSELPIQFRFLKLESFSKFFTFIVFPPIFFII